jgi:hypothetical protein
MARLTRRLPSPAMIVALLALFVALSGTAIAATGGNFILGQANTATTQSTLTANQAGTALQVTNTSTDPTATPLSLKSAKTNPPFTTNSKTKVANLNADFLDGLTSTALQRRISATCPARQAIFSVAADGTPICRSFDSMQMAGQVTVTGGFPYAGNIGSFTTTGGPLLAFATSSGWRTTPGNVSEDLIICSASPCTSVQYITSLQMYGFTNQANSHTNLQTSTGFIQLAAGTYYMNIIPDAATGGQLQTDAADQAQVTIFEL